MKLLVTALLTLVSSYGIYQPRTYGGYGGRRGEYGAHHGAAQFRGHNGGLRSDGFGGARRAYLLRRFLKDKRQLASQNQGAYGTNGIHRDNRFRRIRRGNGQRRGYRANMNNARAYRGHGRMNNGYKKRALTKRNVANAYNQGQRRYRRGGRNNNYGKTYKNVQDMNTQKNQDSYINFSKNNSVNNVNLEARNTSNVSNRNNGYNSGNVIDNKSNYSDDSDMSKSMGRRQNYLDRAYNDTANNQKQMFRDYYNKENMDKKGFGQQQKYLHGAQKANQGSLYRKFQHKKNRHYQDKNSVLAANNSGARANKFGYNKNARNAGYAGYRGHDGHYGHHASYPDKW